jgi:mono/diheme cytochrome c family protein
VQNWPAGRIALLGVAGGIVLAAAVVAIFGNGQMALSPAPAPRPPIGAPGPAGGSDLAPDISRLSAREAADRLFNRVMASAEQGNIEEALRFAPMAVEAYTSLTSLDRDARYHLGLIFAIQGDRARQAQEIAALRQGAPNHLLAITLEHDAAEKAGDRAAMARLRAAFAAAYEAEIGLPRPEYEAHLNAIEKLRTLVGTAPSGPTARRPETALPGALVFAEKCAICHGPAASGTDKGPPLVHRIYEPSHHDDESIRRAVRVGVAQHHWTFGAMAPVPAVSDGEIEQVIAYVRALQRAAGIL